MRRARYLAPWHRDAVDFQDLGDLREDPEVVAETLEALRGKPAIYHVVSRVVNRDRVFGRAEKEHFVKLMRTYEKFCQVRILTHCVMSNHFHLLLEVPAPPPDRGASWSDDDLLTHLACLYSKKQLGEIRWELEHHRSQKNNAAAEALRAKFFARMWDLSAFMKVLKQRFSQWFNRVHARRGTLWEDRFKSVLVESGHAARVTAAYIDLNPVRAGIVTDPKDYRWCGYAEAVAGRERAREGLRLVLFEQFATVTSEKRAAKQVASWREVVRRYRTVLFEDGEEHQRDARKKRAGIAPETVAAVLASGGRLSETQMLSCRVRYLVDGLVLGSERFVNGMHAVTRDYFGPRRRSGARRMRHVQSPLRTMRDLQVDPISA